MRAIQLILGLAFATTGFTGAARAADPTPPPAATTTPDLKMICRSDKEIGSLVKTRKTCHTREQWRYIDDVNQKFARDLVDDTRTKATSN